MVNNDNLVNKLRTVAYYSPYDHNSGNPYWSTGSIGLGTSNMAGRINLSNGQNTNTRIVLGPSTSSTNLDYCSIIESNNTGSLNYGSDLRFYTHSTTTSTTSTERMRIDANGNIGIGTNLPSYKLDILGTTNVTRIKSNQNAVSLLLEDGTTNLSFITSSRFGTLTNGWITIDPNGGTPSGVGFWDNIALSGQMTIGGSYASTAAPSNGLIVQGQVGIGTSSPVSGTSLNVSGGKTLLYSGGGNTTLSLGLTVACDPAANYVLGADPGDSLRNTTLSSNTAGRPVIFCMRNLATNPFWDIIMDPNTSSSLYFATSAGANVLSLKSSGRVGIGTTTPGSLLDIDNSKIDQFALSVSSTGSSYSTTTQSSINQYFISGTVATINTKPGGINTACLIDIGAYNSSNGNSNVYFGCAAGNTNGSGYFVFGRRTGVNSWAESMRLDTNGYLGIGNTSPMYNLDVTGHFGISNGGTYYAKTSTGSYEVFMHPRWSNNATYLNYGSAGFYIRNNDGTTTRMFMGSTGYIGIATTSPLAPLHIVCPGNAQPLVESDTNPGYGFKTTVSSVVRSASITLKSGASDKAMQFYNQTVTSSEMSYNFLNGSAGSLFCILNSGVSLFGATTVSTTPKVYIEYAQGTNTPDSGGLYIYNPTNSANQHSSILVRTAGSSAGNPYLALDIANVGGWSIGVDRADSNKLKFCNNWNFGTSTNTKFSLDANGSIAASSATFTGSITVSSGNTTNAGIILADDGDIVDPNTGYCAMRFSYGVQIYSANKGGSAAITLGSNGNVYCNLICPTELYTTNDNRTITSSYGQNKVRFGFTQYGLNSSGDFADYIFMNTYSDTTGGFPNILMFAKNSVNARLYGNSNNFSKYKDFVMTNENSVNVTLGGTLTTSGRIFCGSAGNGGIWVDGGSQQFVGSVDSTSMGLYNNGAWRLSVLNNGTVTIANGLVNNGYYYNNNRMIIMSSQNGGTNRGIWMWNDSDSNWVIYMAAPGGTTPSGASCPGFMGITGHSIRIRTANGATNGLLYENNSNVGLWGVGGDGMMYFQNMMSRQDTYNTTQSDTLNWYDSPYYDYASATSYDTTNKGYAFYIYGVNNGYASNDTRRAILACHRRMDITRYSNFVLHDGGGGYYWFTHDTTTETINADIPITISSSVATTSLFTSDARIKKDIRLVDTADCLNKIDSMQVTRYNYISNDQMTGSDVIGFIAQQIMEVEPNCVGNIDDYVPNINQFCIIHDLNTSICMTGGWITDSDQRTSYQKRIPNENITEFFYKIDLITTDLVVGDHVKITLELPQDSVVTEIHADNIVVKVDKYFDPIWQVCRNYTPGFYTGENGIKAEMRIDPNITFYKTYVYGKRVSDFHVLDKNRIYAIAVGAIQELSKKVQHLTNEKNTLEQRLSTTENLIQQLIQKYPI